MDRTLLPWHSIDSINWPEYPFCPTAAFRIAYSPTGFYLHYRVEEPHLRARYSEDNGSVWTDSCVEFFFAPAGDGLYYNFECSCTGKLWLCCGRGRENRIFLPDEAYSAVRRRSSLGSRPFGLMETGEWELELAIPARALAFHRLDSFRGLRAKGNFYKCGNKLPRRHYLSWAPVRTPAPDFHRPEFFDDIVFD